MSNGIIILVSHRQSQNAASPWL